MPERVVAAASQAEGDPGPPCPPWPSVPLPQDHSSVHLPRHGLLRSMIFVPRHRALNYMPFQNAETAPRVQVP